MPNKHSLPADFPVENFQAVLLAWYGRKRRELPWRAGPGEKADPYPVWLSEVMLQQTTVKAAVPYFEKFMARWPSLHALAAAPREEVLAAWAGLGYYSRARNLHACARELARTGFPRSVADLRKLPGIGAYTAAAIAAIAFDEPAAVVDGNVERVIARLFAIEMPLPGAKAAIAKLAAALTPAAQPGDYAQAMMDLGATVCTPKSPACSGCPAVHFCTGFAMRRPEDFPVKRQKQAKPLRRGAAYVLVRRNGSTSCILLRKRAEKGLLGGMAEVPTSEWIAAGGSETPALGELGAFNGRWRTGAAVRHTFTHFDLDLAVFASDTEDGEGLAAALGGHWQPLAKLDEAGLPTVMKKAVRSGLHALNLEWPHDGGKAAKSAASVSIVERSARPSTRAGRK